MKFYFLVFVLLLTTIYFIFPKKELPIKSKYTYFIGRNNKPVVIETDSYKLDSPLEKLKVNSDKIYSAEEIQTDIAYLYHAFKYGYGGYHFIDRNIRNKVEKELKQMMKSSKSTSRAELFEKLYKLIDEIPDSHLEIQSRDKDLNAKIWKKYSRPAKETIGKNVASDKKVWKVLRKDDVVIIGIKSCAQPSNEIWEGFFEEVSEKIQNVKNVVLDLRGNNGGNSLIPESLVAYICSKERGKRNSELYRLTPEARLFIYNTVVQYKIPKKSLGLFFEDYRNVKTGKISAQREVVSVCWTGKWQN